MTLRFSGSASCLGYRDFVMLRPVGIIGCGWLGSALASRLVASGVRVVGTTGSRGGAGRLLSIGVEALVLRFSPDAEGDVAGLGDVEAIVVAIPPARELDPLAQAHRRLGATKPTKCSGPGEILSLKAEFGIG